MYKRQGGVLGPCVGLVGIAMVIEAMKVLMGFYTDENFSPFLLQYSGFPQQSLRRFKMRGRKQECITCGRQRTVNRETIESGIINYQTFCGTRNYNVLTDEERIDVTEFENQYWKNKIKEDFILLDVRPSLHYSISHLPNTYNVTVNELKDMNGNLNQLRSEIPSITENSEVLVICRYGNDSQIATKLLKNKFHITNVKDVKGGLFKYIDDVNSSIPKY